MVEAFDLFISYQHDIAEDVMKLYNLISTQITTKIWLDKFQVKSGPILFEQLKQGIDNSRTIVCCITKAYAQSTNCQDEFGYSIYTQKPLLVLMFESIDLTKDIGWMGFKIVNFTRCNVYKSPGVFDSKCGPIYDEMMTSIHALLGSPTVIRTKEKNKAVVQAVTKLPYNIEAKYYLDYEKCNICNEEKDCLKLWTLYYCENCWYFLGCTVCKNKIDKKKAYRGDNNEVLCEKCISNESLATLSSSTEDKPFDISKTEIITAIEMCHVCEKDQYPVHRLWTHYYCSRRCWKILACKSCDNVLDKKKVYRGKNNDVFCKNCISKNKMDVDKEETVISKSTSVVNTPANTNYIEIKSSPFNIVNVKSDYWSYKSCHVCKKEGVNYRLWLHYYCQSCWNYLGCNSCNNIISKDKAYRGKNDNVFCDKCIDKNRKQVIKYNTADIINVHVLPINIANVKSDYWSYKSCHVCKKEGVNYEVWTHYYCEDCWKYLGCKSCDNKVDKSKAYRGQNNDVFCNLCISIKKKSISCVCL